MGIRVVPDFFFQVLCTALMGLTFTPLGGEAGSSILRLDVVPGLVRLSGASGRQQLAVTGVAANGCLSDLTHKSRFSVVPPTVASVSPTGVVTPLAAGMALLKVEAGSSSTSVELIVENPGAVRPVSYRHEVAALLSKAGCNMGACHGNLNGKGGFKLSLRGEDLAFDLTSLTRDAFARRTDVSAPSESLVVKKPTGLLPHEGGLRFLSSSPEAATLVGWIAAGARDDVEKAAKLVRLDVSPKDRVAAPGALSQQLIVTAEFSDGARRDVTRLATYDVSDPTRASVTVDGRVEASRPTETVVAVRYLDGRGVSRLAFLHDRPGFVWRDRAVRNVIDGHVFQKLKEVRTLPSEPATDPVFLRRAYLDAIGRLPSVEEARAFLSESNPEKRSILIDRLVRRPEFADFWALKWADLLRNEEKTMGEKGVWVFQRWLRDQIAADVPLSEFASRLVTAKGSTWSNPPASFYRTNRDPQTTAETVAQVFLGVRLQCARCHNHPFDVWTQDDYYGLSAYFGNVRRKDMDNQRKDNLDKHEVNGDEIVYLEGRPEAVQPRSGATLAPKPPGGSRPELLPGTDARVALAQWLTHDNRQFARNLANRVWFHLMGRGVVEPVDDFRESNPPSNPALLDALTEALVANGFKLRPFVALIMKSETYQFAAEPNESNADDEANFARASVRLLPAEVMLDALGQALGKPSVFPDGPRGMTTTQLPGARMGGGFLKAFGKPDRLLTCECERTDSTTLSQAFQLINGPSVRSMLEAQDNRIGRLLASGISDEAMLADLTLAALAREPNASERSSFLGHVRKAEDRRKAWEDVAWALVNSKEFLLRR